VSDKFISGEDAETIRRELAMTKIGKMIYEDGIEKGERNGRREERIVAVFNMLKLSVPESQILELYSAEDLKAAKQRQ